MEVTNMSNTKQNNNHPKKGDSNPNPKATSENIKISEIPGFLKNKTRVFPTRL